MPIYDYRCDACGGTYDIFHKVREVAEDVVCPSCGSLEHTRLISAPSFTVGSSTPPSVAPPSCETGSCCGGGACGMN